MTTLSVEIVPNVVQVDVVQNGPVDIVEVLHPGPRGLNALDLNHIDGGAAATVYGPTPYDVIDGGGA